MPRLAPVDEHVCLESWGRRSCRELVHKLQGHHLLWKQQPCQSCCLRPTLSPCSAAWCMGLAGLWQLAGTEVATTGSDFRSGPGQLEVLSCAQVSCAQAAEEHPYAIRPGVPGQKAAQDAGSAEPYSAALSMSKLSKSQSCRDQPSTLHDSCPCTGS